MVKSRPRRMIALELHAQREDGLNLVAHQFARQAENGDAGREHAAGFAVALEDGDLVADRDQVVRHGEAADAGADHRDALVVAAIRAAASRRCSPRGRCA